MKRLIFTLIVCALMATPALANITILQDYPGAPYTNAIWEFGRADTVYAPGGTTWQITESVASDFLQPGNDTATASVTVTETTATPYWEDGNIYGHDIDFVVTIPNMEYEPFFKLVQVEIQYTICEGGSGHGLVGALVTAPSGSVIELVGVGDLPDPVAGFNDATLLWKIWPQPSEETITLNLEDSGVVLHSVEIATVCIPAPGAIILGSLGVGLVGWLRRRKSL